MKIAGRREGGLTHVKLATTRVRFDCRNRSGEDCLARLLFFVAVLIGGTLNWAGLAAAQPIEDELVLITPVGKSFSDPALAEFRNYAKQRWNVDVKASALAAGTPIAYGQIVEWKGRPQADLFWGGESALYDRLAAQGLLVPLGLPRAVTFDIDVLSVYDDEFAQKRYEQVNATFRKEIESVYEELKRKY
jgi:hypothetical protein